MFKNKIFIFFLVLVFSVGLVSAEEISDIGELDSFDFYSDDLEINDEMKTYSVAGNFTCLEQEIISKEVVDLEGKTILYNDTGKYANGISINKTVTIRNGVIDGNNEVRIFNIVSGGNLILENITLQNGHTNSNGGAINNNGNVTISNSTLNNNKANSHGGAIYNNGGSDFNISNSTLNNNNATLDGGAIYNNGNVTISNSTLNNNIANYYGGAINNNGNVTISNSTLNNNTANWYGGAINNNGNVTISNSTLNNNKANMGGAIFNSGGDFTISNSTLNNNTANEWGGAIVNSGDFTISNSTLNNNKANSNGGAIYNNGNDFNISNSTLNNNNANSHGGAIYNNGGNNFNISNSTLNNNKANSNGGAIINTGGVFTISNSTLNNNTASSGGAIYNNGNDFTISNSTLNNNKANWYGGAIYNNGNDFNISNSTLNNNNASGWGGAIYNNGNDFNISNSTLNNNNASSGGAIFNNYGGDFTISNSTLNNNKANMGGAIFNSGGDFSISNSTLNNNTANEWGGAIFNSGDFTISNSTLNNNKANMGGAIFNSGGDFTISNSTLNNNTANEWGGAIVNSGDFTISNSTLNNNTANEWGGAIYNNGNDFNISNSTLNNNNASSGGAIYNSGILLVSDSLLNNSRYNNHLIYNDQGATLSLKNNTMFNDYSEQIYNNGTINTKIYLIILGNDTYYGVPGGDVLLDAFLTDDNGNVIVGQNITLFNNTIFNVNLTDFEDGLYTKNITSPNIGKYLINGTYIGGTNITVQTALLVVKNNAAFNLNESNMIYNENQTIKIITNVTGNITIYYNGKNQTLNITNGEVIFTDLNLPAGENNITIFYSGDDNYYSKTFNTTVSVLKSNKTDINVTNPNIVSSENQTITVTIAPNATGNMTLTINNKNYTNEIINGTVSFNVTDLNPDNYTAIITYPGDSNYNGFNKTLNITIAKTNALLDANDTFLFYRNGTQYIAVLKDSNNNPIVGVLIQITINGVTYNRTTNSYGKVFLNINLRPNTYNVTATFNGSSKYFNTSINNFVVVNSTLLADDLTKYFRNGSQYTVEVLDKKGKPINNTLVEFNINGVFYNRTSNENGIATLNINLDPNTYIITVKCNDLEISNNIKVLPILIGENLNKTFGDNDTYNVEVLDDKGNKVINQTIQININGIIYNRTSDNNGIVKLNINLDPGSYIATASWKDFHTSNIITVNK
ncbi:beta strand repeat-containing protein [Methanobrevibacter sp. DSM 116169]|uniref:beta strand repeat-containing protein n=1 Tax=Methanobrevibacter sp. DSM 116169 TaxID=3242727 RepID=UPI0038FD02AE